MILLPFMKGLNDETEAITGGFGSIGGNIGLRNWLFEPPTTANIYDHTVGTPSGSPRKIGYAAIKESQRGDRRAVGPGCSMPITHKTLK